MGSKKDTEMRLKGGAAQTALIHNPSSVPALGRTISKCFPSGLRGQLDVEQLLQIDSKQ